MPIRKSEAHKNNPKRRTLVTPSREELDHLYNTLNYSAYRIGKHYGVAFSSVKNWLLIHQLWDNEKAIANLTDGTKRMHAEERITKARELLSKAGMTIVEVVDEANQSMDANGEVNGSPNVVQQPGGNSIVPALPTEIGPTGGNQGLGIGSDLEESAYERLSYNQRRAVDLMADTVNRTTYEAIAERIGISPETLLVYRKDPVFQQALEEVQNPLFKSDLRTLYRGSLMNKLTTGKDSKEDRLLAARIVGDAGPDSTLNTAIQVNIKGDW